MSRILLPITASLFLASSAFAQETPFLLDAAEDLPGVTATPPAGPAAKAPASTVAVLALAGAEGIGISDLQLAAQQGIEKRTALKVQTLEPEQEKEVRKCAGDPSCFADELRKAGSNADLLLTVSVTSLGEGQVLLGLLLVDARSGSELAGRQKIPTGELAEELPPGVSPARSMPDYLGKVFPPSVWGQIASMKINANEENAEVEVRGAGVSCVTPCTIDRVFPGKYEVIIKKSGYIPYSEMVDVRSGQLGKVEASLEEEPTSVWKSPWLWAGVGVAAVAAGVTTAVLVAGGNDDLIICIGQNEADCAN